MAKQDSNSSVPRQCAQSDPSPSHVLRELPSSCFATCPPLVGEFIRFCDDPARALWIAESGLSARKPSLAISKAHKMLTRRICSPLKGPLGGIPGCNFIFPRRTESLRSRRKLDVRISFRGSRINSNFVRESNEAEFMKQ